MSEFSISLILTLIGVFMGAFLSPLAERYILRSREHSISTGLALLCAANGIWLCTVFIWHNHPLYGQAYFAATLIVLYIIVAFLMILAFINLLKSTAAIQFTTIRPLLLLFVLGNLIWIIGVSAEIFLSIFSLDKMPYLWGKHALNIIAAIVFFSALFWRYIAKRFPYLAKILAT